MPKKESILFITHGLNPEGSPRHIVNLAHSLCQEYSVAVFSHIPGALSVELERKRIKTIIAPPPAVGAIREDANAYYRKSLAFLETGSLKGWRESIKNIATFLIRKLGKKPDAIVANTVLGFWAVDLARLWNIPVIWCIHESTRPFVQLEWMDQKLSGRIPEIFSAADDIIFVSRATLSLFEENGYYSSAPRVVPVALEASMPVFAKNSPSRGEARKLLGLHPDEANFLILGTVAERKGQLDICHALASMENVRNMCFTFVGDRPGTPYSLELHKAISGLPRHKKEKVRIFPETSGVAMHYHAADAFVLTSRIESYPYVILEAMSQGLPIIATPVFGVKEQLEPDDALFYEPGDVSVLASHIARLGRDASLRKMLGARSLRRYNVLPDYATILAEYRKILRERLAASRGC